MPAIRHGKNGLEHWEQMGFTVRRVLDDIIDYTVVPEAPSKFLQENGLLPVRLEGNGGLLVAVSGPDDGLALDFLASWVNRPLSLLITSREEIHRHILERNAAHRKLSREKPREDAPEEARHTQRELLAAPEQDSQVIRIVNDLLLEALERNASDIHIEPHREGVRVRYRIDGLLHDALAPPGNLKDHIISRIKLMAGMDISHRLAPQDGSVSLTCRGEPVDIRISSIPTPFGERVVLRLLRKQAGDIQLEQLGMAPEIIGRIEKILHSGSGLFIVSGPTGSGKTTTLYACLRRMDTAARNVITIEDPVEYEIPGISQVQVGGKRCIDFAGGLRSMLRQDPDVIMVGEIRDGETAGIALQAALTGHLILTTIHTDRAEGAVIRLLDLGADPAAIAETLSGTLEQRLIRRLCPRCAESRVFQRSGTPPGCSYCGNTGYRGRTGLFRFIPITSDIRRAIRKNDPAAVQDGFRKAGSDSLAACARKLEDAGLTTREEILRALGDVS